MLGDKLREEKKKNDLLRELQELNNEELEGDFISNTYHYLKVKLYDLKLTEMVKKSNILLRRYSIQYLKCKNKVLEPNDRFTEYQIQSAREYPIEDLIEGRIRITGSRKTALCPFHEEKTPSFVIYESNSYHCFGCGEHGANAIDFLMKRDGLTFKEGIKALI